MSEHLLIRLPGLTLNVAFKLKYMTWIYLSYGGVGNVYVSVVGAPLHDNQEYRTEYNTLCRRHPELVAKKMCVQAFLKTALVFSSIFLVHFCPRPLQTIKFDPKPT